MFVSMAYVPQLFPYDWLLLGAAVLVHLASNV